MTNSDPAGHQTARRSVPGVVKRLLPFLGWFDRYDSKCLSADLLAGLTVALVLIPQSMAYAQLADLPTYYGLYAAFLPPLVAAAFGSSRQLATGPVAVVSLMTATGLAPLATAGSEAFIAYAILLALMVGIFQFLLGVLRLGIIVNFLSHPVVNGFTNAAAIIIATSQLGKLFGVQVDRAEHHYETVYRTMEAAVHYIHWPTLALGLLAFAIMATLKRVNPRVPNVLIAVVVTTVISWAISLDHDVGTSADRIHAPGLSQLVDDYNVSLAQTEEVMATRIAKGQELKSARSRHGEHSLEVIDLTAEVAKLDIAAERFRQTSGTLRAELRGLRLAGVGPEDSELSFYEALEIPDGSPVQGDGWSLIVGNRRLDPGKLRMRGGGAVVGEIPAGLPDFAVPTIDFGAIGDLIPMAVIISLLGFMEAISIAKAMANRTGQRLDPNQELIGQGLGNLVGAFTSSYAVSGSFSRSAVNIQAGAVTGLSSVFSSVVVLITLLMLTPLLYHLPQSVLAAIIIMAVVGLVNVKGFVHAWHAQKTDGVVSMASFVCTLGFAPHLDKGIMIGVGLSLVLFLFRNMSPKVEVLSRTKDGFFRSASRWKLETCDHVTMIRFNGSIFFANANHVETHILREVAERPNLKHLVIVGNGINDLDASGEVMLSFLVSKLRASGLDISFSGLNDQVIDLMQRSHLFEKIGEDHFYANASEAIREIHQGVCLGEEEADCPLLRSSRLDEPAGPSGTDSDQTSTSSD